MKKGITVSMIAIFVTIMIILAATISISATKTIANANLRSFGAEISIVQDEVTQKQKEGTNLDYTLGIIAIDLTDVESDIKTEQFAGENIENNKLQLYELDLNALKLHNTRYGNKNTEKDIYTFSIDTGKVYYVEGIKANGITYYTLTEDLKTQLGIKYEAVDLTSKVRFIPSNIYYTSDAITTKVVYPKSFTNVTVTATEGVTCGNEYTYTNTEYYVIDVNKADIKSNYNITITYTKDGTNKQEIFKIENYDGEAPEITVGEKIGKEQGLLYLTDIKATDKSGIKILKYESEEIKLSDAKEYFSSYGKNIESGKILLSGSLEAYTIYAEDSAGNYNIYKVDLSIIEDGLICHLDGVQNTKAGHSISTTVWEDLTDNNNNFQIRGVQLKIIV